jgi:hypothetical protein
MTLRRTASVFIRFRNSLHALLAAAVLAAPIATYAQVEAEGETTSSGPEPESVSAQGGVDLSAWGIFAKLAGNRWQTPDGVVRVFEWKTVGQELVESELVGGVPRPKNIYEMQGSDFVRHTCLGYLKECARVETHYATVEPDGSVVFKDITANGFGRVKSVQLRERPAPAEWKKWKKYSLFTETVYVYTLDDANQLKMTQSLYGKHLYEAPDAPWSGPQVQANLAYSWAGPAEGEYGPAADFGPMEIFAGQRMISEDFNEILELQHLPDGTRAIQWFSLYGQPLGRYVFKMNAETGELQLLDYPYTDSQSRQMRFKFVMWTGGNTLFFGTQIEGTNRSLYHSFSVYQGKLLASRSDSAQGRTLLGKPKITDFTSGDRLLIPATPELLAEAIEVHQRRLEAQARQAEREAEERRRRQVQAERDFARFMGGLNTFVNTFNESMAEARENEARRDAFLADLRRQSEEIDRRRRAQQQASAGVQPNAQPLPIEAPRQPSAPATRPTSAQNPPTTPPPRTPEEPKRTPERKLALTPTPEAVVVCTHPDESGRFRCASPTHSKFEGGPYSGALWKTPEEYVAQSGSCGSARKLQSATHLVWGCGYGATNGGNSMDRSAGVDVKGRNTYYCVAAEWPCRRTSPE